MNQDEIDANKLYNARNVDEDKGHDEDFGD